jgi:hypothetical protein
MLLKYAIIDPPITATAVVSRLCDIAQFIPNYVQLAAGLEALNLSPDTVPLRLL